jgi:hypothetical protein
MIILLNDKRYRDPERCRECSKRFQSWVEISIRFEPPDGVGCNAHLTGKPFLSQPQFQASQANPSSLAGGY